jgi:hypothetical protein
MQNTSLIVIIKYVHKYIIITHSILLLAARVGATESILFEGLILSTRVNNLFRCIFCLVDTAIKLESFDDSIYIGSSKRKSISSSWQTMRLFSHKKVQSSRFELM